MSMLMLRFMGEMPKERFDFQCLCGHPSFGEHWIEEVDREERIRFTCDSCGAKYIMWQQKTHWHLNFVPGK